MCALVMGSAANAGTAPGQTAPTASMSSGAAAPNTQVQEIVVAAQKRTESLQDAPPTVTVAGSQSLQGANVRDIRDLQVLIPGWR